MNWPTDHRPWPVPSAPWVMFQQWENLLFAHWRLPVDILRPLVPSALALDTFEGEAWVGITPFQVTGARPRLLPPVPGMSAFPELNVRTYVTVEDKPGIYFFSLDAANAVAVAGARAAYHLPYYNADMAVERVGEGVAFRSYRSHAGAAPAELRMRYRPVGEVFHPERGTLEYFLAERYCLYSVDSGGHVYHADIHHGPWPLQAAEAEIQANTMDVFNGFTLPKEPPLLHFARVQPTVIWAPERLHTSDAPQWTTASQEAFAAAPPEPTGAGG